MPNFSYVFLDRDILGESPCTMVPCKPWGQETGRVLEFELDVADVPEHWQEELAKYDTGFYYLEYDTDTETEGDYREVSYLVVNELLSIRPSEYAKWLFFYHYELMPIVDAVIGLFCPIWAAAFEYGVFCNRSPRTNILKAFWFCYFQPAQVGGYTRRYVTRN